MTPVHGLIWQHISPHAHRDISVSVTQTVDHIFVFEYFMLKLLRDQCISTVLEIISFSQFPVFDVWFNEWCTPSTSSIKPIIYYIITAVYLWKTKSNLSLSHVSCTQISCENCLCQFLLLNLWCFLHFLHQVFWHTFQKKQTLSAPRYFSHLVPAGRKP